VDEWRKREKGEALTRSPDRCPAPGYHTSADSVHKAKTAEEENYSRVKALAFASRRRAPSPSVPALGARHSEEAKRARETSKVSGGLTPFVVVITVCLGMR
jgi:hypothetical protein